ncbi:hypothetical protein [uncultured Methylobacterium sp.]|uniref:hypothetical protein n=1 Tax=uncultured Methylobacterium sp. TaxID=157278 RepID=UPI0035CA5FA9
MITLRSDVQRPLYVGEIDGNFSDLDGRLRDIETRGLLGIALADVSWDAVGEEVTFSYEDGQTYGPIELPASMFKARGDWVIGTPYEARDLVTVSGSSYVARGDHVAGAFADDLLAGKWQVVAAAGKDPFAVSGPFNALKVYSLGDSVFYAAAGFAVQRVVYVPTGGLPAGTLPGARDPATGFPHWLPVTEPSRAFDIAVDNNGKLTAGQNILNRLTGVPYKLPANLAGSTFNLPFSAPSADMTFRITRLNAAGSGGQIGTVLFKAGSTVGTATLTETAFAAGDLLLVNAPDVASAQTTGAQFVIVARAS